MDTFTPKARRESLLSQELPDEVVVYDTARHQVHCLNLTATLVWKQCDGQTTVTEIARLVGARLEIPPDEAVVWHALDQLAEFHLLEESTTRHVTASVLTRRALMQRLAAAGVALAAVTSIQAPLPADAQSGATGPTGATGATGETGPTGPG